MVSLETLTRVKDPPTPVAEEGTTEPLMTVAEVARRLKCSRWTVYKLIRSGELGHYKIPSRIRVSEAHLNAYLAGAARQ